VDWKRAELLFERAMSCKASDGEIEELYNAFYEGFSLDYLRRMLRSNNSAVIRSGAFILSELGTRAFPLLCECRNLLKQNNNWVLGDTLDVIIVNAKVEHRDLLAMAICLVDDPRKGVAWKCLGFIKRLDRSRLSAALGSNILNEIRPHLEWLLAQERTSATEEISERIQCTEWRTRAFGAVAAARRGLAGAPLLKLTAHTD
jgi:hypothetical protein